MHIDIKNASRSSLSIQVMVMHDSASLDLGMLNEAEVKELILQLSSAITELCEAIQ